MIRRPRRSPAAGLVALVLLAVCVLVAVACVQLLLGRPPVISFADLGAVAAGSSPRDPLFLAVSGVLVFLGLVLLLVAIRPGTPTVLPLGTPEGAPKGTASVDTGILRRSLDRALSDAATGVDGVAKAGARSRGRRATVTARASHGEPRELREQVRAAVAERLEAIGPARTPRLTVKVTAPDTAAAGPGGTAEEA
ncbi:DUF6286 domain-containing protein [Pseudonocardia nantongensis]|uniref:DUF6286 domain-containing protein n=1 Tax=Pseudonocardia nantongensis TaxID=1181885 RepID=UPI00397D0A8B